MVGIRNFQTCRGFSEEFVGATLMTYAGEQGLKCCAEEQFCLFFFFMHAKLRRERGRKTSCTGREEQTQTSDAESMTPRSFPISQFSVFGDLFMFLVSLLGEQGRY